jgi:hypothetical protein
MTLRLIREPSRDEATMGVLFVNGHYECFCVEDMIREVSGVPVEAWKVVGRTAIPQGRYRIQLTHSQRFNRTLPLLVDVPGFTGVRIHPGNTAADTEGCLLLGTGRTGGSVTGSRIACERLFERMAADPFEQWSTIENPAA